MKTFEAEDGVGMTVSEAKRFLSKSRSNLLLGTVDEAGDPNIHAVWYYFDADRVRLYFITEKNSRKARNIRRRKTVYFNVDDDRSYRLRGVRGKGRARFVTNRKVAMSLTMLVLARYVKPEHPLTPKYADEVRNGDSTVIEIAPSYMTTWDYRKLSPSVLKERKESALA
jgi:nitroimidazol reductase NimA-like FMN-containing flavoprotein (pyridoxamine 5'-phosphate oxidase superfamily)